MACCGRQANVYLNNVEVGEAYIGEITADGEATDVTVFGDPASGTTIVCKETASVVINSYEDTGVSVGESVSFSCNVCSESYSSNDCEVLTKNCRFEASGVPYWVTTLRVNDAITDF